MTSVVLSVADEQAMVDCGVRLGQLMPEGILYLHGELGAGKTTFCRGVVRSRGHQGAVKSPTYTLVEPYDFASGAVYHFDLYRLSDPEELEFMGIRDYFQAGNLCLVEWPERGVGVLPEADLDVSIAVSGRGRELRLAAVTDKGASVLRQW